MSSKSTLKKSASKKTWRLVAWDKVTGQPTKSKAPMVTKGVAQMNADALNKLEAHPYRYTIGQKDHDAGQDKKQTQQTKQPETAKCKTC